MAGLDEFRQMAAKVSNWGRWGEHDELGTLNFIDAEKVLQASSLVRRGAVFPLGLSFDAYGPQEVVKFRTNPVHVMSVLGGDASFVEHMADWDENPTAKMLGAMFQNLDRFNDDYIMMPLQCATQWDALSHAYYEGQMYNGFPAGSVTSLGARYLSIDKVDVKGIVSRGVLLDVARHRGVEFIELGTAISPEELDDVARAQGVTIEPGDIVCIRTGWCTMFLSGGHPATKVSGLSWRCAEWISDHQVAAMAADNLAVEGNDREVEGVALALHLLCLRDMGLMFGEMWNLDALAADCVADGVWEFQLIAPPLRVTGAVGTPLNPIALK